MNICISFPLTSTPNDKQKKKQEFQNELQQKVYCCFCCCCCRLPAAAVYCDNWKYFILQFSSLIELFQFLLLFFRKIFPFFKEKCFFFFRFYGYTRVNAFFFFGFSFDYFFDDEEIFFNCKYETFCKVFQWKVFTHIRPCIWLIVDVNMDGCDLTFFFIFFEIFVLRFLWIIDSWETF